MTDPKSIDCLYFNDATFTFGAISDLRPGDLLLQGLRVEFVVSTAHAAVNDAFPYAHAKLTIIGNDSVYEVRLNLASLNWLFCHNTDKPLCNPEPHRDTLT